MRFSALDHKCYSENDSCSSALNNESLLLVKTFFLSSEAVPQALVCLLARTVQTHHICCPAPPTSLNQEVHSTFGFIQLCLSSLLRLQRETNLSVTPAFHEGENTLHVSYSQQTHTHNVAVLFRQNRTSHTLHATLDGALFIVIDLLLPNLTC